MMTIELITTTDQFCSLKDSWDNLLEKSASKSVFLTWEWLYHWWVHFKGNKELNILLVKDKQTGELLGIAPFCVTETKIFNLLKLKKIKFLGAEKVASDFLDFIIYPGKEKIVLESIYEYLLEERKNWDIIEIGDILESSTTREFFNHNLNGSLRFKELNAEICPYIDLPQSHEEFFKNLGAKMRRNLRWQTRQLEQKYKVTFSINGAENAIRKNIEALFLLHEDRFKAKRKEKNAVSSFGGEQLKSFHRDIAMSFLPKGYLRLFILTEKGNLIGCSYAFKFKDELFYYQTGIDSEWKKFGLGTTILGNAIQHSIQEGLNQFHFLRGDEAYKFNWTKKTLNTKNLILINKNFKGLIYSSNIFMKTGYASLKTSIKKLLKHLYGDGGNK